MINPEKPTWGVYSSLKLDSCTTLSGMSLRGSLIMCDNILPSLPSRHK